MTSKEIQKELVKYYQSKGIDNKVTAVPDGCWVYMGNDTGKGKLFVNAIDYSREKQLTYSMLVECDARLR